MKMLDKILERYVHDDILKADGFDDAVIGIDEEQMRLIYSVAKCIDILKLEMSEEDAIEHFTFNVAYGYGEGYPIWCWDYFA